MSTTIDGSASVTINSGAVLGITSSTAQNSTSGTYIDFTGIPSWVKRVTVLVNGVSTNSTSNLQIQLGVSGTPETTGYSTISGVITTTNNTTRSATPTTGFPFSNGSSAASLYYGTFIFTLIGSNVWSGFGNVYDSSGGIGCLAGAKTLAGTLNMIRLTTVNGTDTFDAGTVNILYE